MSGFSLDLQNLSATVKTVGVDVMTQVDFAGRRLHSDSGHIQCTVRTVHAALGRRFFVLLNGHGRLLVLKIRGVGKNAISPFTRHERDSREALDYILNKFTYRALACASQPVRQTDWAFLRSSPRNPHRWRPASRRRGIPHAAAP